jgi:hypothetical protein
MSEADEVASQLERLPFEFQGLWISRAFGGFNPPLIARFRPKMPKDLLYKRLRKTLPELMKRPHEYAKPEWVSKEEMERKYGSVEAVYVAPEFGDRVDWNDCRLERILIWTDRFVLTLEEYDGSEYFIALPRNPPTEMIVATAKEVGV